MKLYVYFFLLAIPFSANAQQMYKSVDKDGNVSYSSTPKPQAAEVKQIAPPPVISDEQKLRSQQQQEDIRAKAESIDREREQSTTKEAIKEAENKVEELEIYRQQNINDPGRAGQNPQPGVPAHPIQPVPAPTPAK